jgi:hypothetical protein
MLAEQEEIKKRDGLVEFKLAASWKSQGLSFSLFSFSLLSVLLFFFGRIPRFLLLLSQSLPPLSSVCLAVCCSMHCLCSLRSGYKEDAVTIAPIVGMKQAQLNSKLKLQPEDILVSTLLKVLLAISPCYSLSCLHPSLVLSLPLFSSLSFVRSSLCSRFLLSFVFSTHSSFFFSIRFSRKKKTLKSANKKYKTSKAKAEEEEEPITKTTTTITPLLLLLLHHHRLLLLCLLPALFPVCI